MSVLYSPRGYCPISLWLTLMTAIARLDIPTRYYSETLQDCGAARGRPRGKATGGQRVIRGQGSTQRYQAVHAHTRQYEAWEGFVGFSGPKVVESLGKKQYTLIVRDDFLQYTCMYFMRHKSDAA